MRLRLSILVLLLLTSGCTTAIINEFHGELRNIKRDGQTATIRSPIAGYCSGPSTAGGRFVGFLLPTTEFSFVLFHPALVPGQTLVTNTPWVDAWLLRRSDFDWSDVFGSGDSEQLRRHDGERLVGRVAIRWKTNADFYIGVDLAGADTGSTSLRGEFIGYAKTKADPAVLWQAPAMLLFGADGWSNPKPLQVVPANASKNP